MSWVWIAALTWVVLAVPLALVVGRLLRWSEERGTLDPVAWGPDDGNGPVDRRRGGVTGRGTGSRPAGGSTLPSSIARSIHPPRAGQPPHRAAGPRSATPPLPTAPRRRVPPHRHP